jgi:phosphoribosyl-ATP pyrophosphohydrolase
MQQQILDSIDKILIDRKQQSADESYVASLYAKGLEEILKKISEEATEVVMAAKDNAQPANKATQEHLVSEIADLWFHSMVLLAHQDLNSTDIMNELERRLGLSGLVEKANRNKPK